MVKKGSFYSASRFYATEHFPYGIARSGEFIVSHAELLECHGNAYSDLHAGIREPVNEEENRFLEVCQDEREAVTNHEKAWAQYCLKTKKKPSVSPFGQGRQTTAYELSNESALVDEFITE